MAKEKKEPSVVIDGVDTKLTDLNEEQRYFVHQVQDLSNKQFRVQSELDQINAALSVYKNALLTSREQNISEDDSEGEKNEVVD
tara:strand:+ start:44 stop:295 length:252 start_codon:yes stop_codon:yes gene_type:complete